MLKTNYKNSFKEISSMHVRERNKVYSWISFIIQPAFRQTTCNPQGQDYTSYKDRHHMLFVTNLMIEPW